MAVKIFENQFKDFSKHNLLRGDLKFIKYTNNVEKKYQKFFRIKDIITYYYKGFAFKGKDFKKEGIVYALKGTVFNEDLSVDFDNIEYLPQRLYDNPKYDKFKVRKNDIVISLVGSIGKVAIIKDNYKMLLNQNNIALRIDTTLYNEVFLSYLLKLLLEEMYDNLFKNSGYSFLAIEDLFNIHIPIVPITKQIQLVEKIKLMENKIAEYKCKIKSTKEVLDGVFSKYFNINWDIINEKSNVKVFDKEIGELSKYNTGLKLGTRWNKFNEIQDELYRQNNHVKKLGRYIKEIKGGWSPKCNEGILGTAVLGIDSIRDSRIHFNNLKYTSETKNNMSNFFVKKGDFFVSRGNTLELVAMAGVVEQKIDENVIFPDLMKLVIFNEKYVNKKYMAHVFNSSIGRIYFKYCSKGKNQSMVKISSKELLDFLVPIPKLNIQNKIVEEIKIELKNQEKIKDNINEQFNNILKMVSETIK